MSNSQPTSDEAGLTTTRSLRPLSTAISSSGAIQAQLSDMQKQIAKLESLLKAQSRPNGEQ